MDNLSENPDYQEFVQSMVKFCHCEYDKPCDSVLAAGPCEKKKFSIDDLFDDDDLDEMI
jgi:hypothetical protein